ncbi:MAG: SEC-C metal-binding domain-containing protein [Anaeromyxobacter sp.]
MSAARYLGPEPPIRDLSVEWPIFLWRPDGTGRREGLLLRTPLCPDPSCSERHLLIDAHVVSDDLLGTESFDVQYPPGVPEVLDHAFTLRVALDDGEVEPTRRVDLPDALAWFLQELDPELLSTLRRRFVFQRRERGVAEGIPVRRIPQPGRNEPCPCGSRREFKFCCVAEISADSPPRSTPS